MNANPTAPRTGQVPATSLLDLYTRKVAPFDQPFYLMEVDGLKFGYQHPSMQTYPLVEGVRGVQNAFLPDLTEIHVTIWTAKRMVDLVLNPEDTVTVQVASLH